MNLSQSMADLKQIYASRENPMQTIEKLLADNKKLELSNKAFKGATTRRNNQIKQFRKHTG